MNALPLSSYRKAVSLDAPFVVSPGTGSAEGLLAMLGGAVQLRGTPRESLYATLTSRSPKPFPGGFLEVCDGLLAREASERPVVDPKGLPRTSQLTLWRGDITHLKTDAIVNAANSALLGCFQPFHACIDNAIHAAAGPRLRTDCHAIMTLQGHEEPTAHAKVTRGYHLPARFVVHTVGPIFDAAQPGRMSALLAQSYQACLDLAAQVDAIRSIAFPCISTGVFGFPAPPAARVAVDTVRAWLREHPGRIDQVVFNVFSQKDEALYRAALAEVQS